MPTLHFWYIMENAIHVRLDFVHQKYNLGLNTM